MSCISRVNLCPASGDTENVLLQKILQSLNEGAGGGGGGGVTGLSVNGGPFQTGNVSIVTGGGSGTVTSVNGDPGPAVLLDSGEVPEGLNLYFTTARVRATDLTGLVSALGAITAADTVLSAFGKTQGRLAALESGAAGPFLLRAGDTGTGPFIFTPSAANTTPLTLSGFSLTGASAVPALDISGTWNTTGAPTALDVNVLNTASAAASLLFNFRLSSVGVFELRKDGRLSLAGRASFTTTSPIGHALNVSDAGTTAAPLVLTLGHVLSSGTAAAGMGVRLDYSIDSTTTVNTTAAQLFTTWTDATHATRTAIQTFTAFTAGVIQTQMVLGNGQVQGSPGTAALPTFTNRNDTDTGLFLVTADSLGLSTAGVARLTISTTVITPSLIIQGADGAAPTPAYSFSADTNTGMYRPSADTIAFATGAAFRFSVSTAEVTSTLTYWGPDASAALPTYAFTNDSNTGIYSAAADAIGFSTGGTLRLTVATALITATVPIQQSNSTALGADPTAASTQWAVGGEWQYRSSLASEGAGQTNRVHNRSEEVAGVGTNYTLTNTIARVDFGTTDPEVVLPTAGTYLILAGVQFQGDALSVNDDMVAICRNSTDAVDIGRFALITLGANYFGRAVLSVVVSVTASKTIQVWARNATAARGLVLAIYTSIKYIRLY